MAAEEHSCVAARRAGVLPQHNQSCSPFVLRAPLSLREVGKWAVEVYSLERDLGLQQGTVTFLDPLLAKRMTLRGIRVWMVVRSHGLESSHEGEDRAGCRRLEVKKPQQDQVSSASWTQQRPE